MTLATAGKAVLPGNKRPHLRALTSLRIFAAMYVVTAHFGMALMERDVRRIHAWAEKSQSAMGRPAEFLAAVVFHSLNCAAVSVSMFFVLSGFILAYNYLDPETRPTRRRDFWIARFARVYPAYLLAWIIAAPAAIHAMRSGLEHASHLKLALLPLMSLTVVHAWMPSWSLQWNSPSWSLCTEAAFYALFPLVFLRADGRPRRVDGGGRRRQMMIAGIWITLAALPPALYAIIDPDHIGQATMRAIGSIHISHGPWLDTLGPFPLLRLPELFLGAAVGRLFLMDVHDGKRAPAWIAPAALAAIIAAIVLRPIIPYSVYVAGGGMASLFAVLIYGLAHGGWPARWISRGWLVLLGEASYGIYILHAPLGGWFRGVVTKLDPQLFAGQTGELARVPSWGYFAAFILVLVPFCILSFKFFETPARYVIRKRLK